MIKSLRYIFVLVLIAGTACGKGKEKAPAPAPDAQWHPKMLDMLGLNDNQKNNLTKDFLSNKKKFLMQTKKIREIKGGIKKILHSFPVDKAKIKDLTAQLVSAKTEMVEMQIQSSMNLVSQLDKKQHANYVSLSNKKMEKLQQNRKKMSDQK